MTMAQDAGKMVSPMHRPPLPQGGKKAHCALNLNKRPHYILSGWILDLV